MYFLFSQNKDEKLKWIKWQCYCVVDNLMDLSVSHTGHMKQHENPPFYLKRVSKQTKQYLESEVHHITYYN